MTSLFTKKMIVLLLAATFSVSSAAMADMENVIYGQRAHMSSYNITYGIMIGVEGGNWIKGSAEPFRGGPVGSGINDMNIFVLSLWDCPDSVNASNALNNFVNPLVGINFNRTTSLADAQLNVVQWGENNPPNPGTYLDNIQKAAIQTLVDHVYRPMVDAWDNYVNLYSSYAPELELNAAFDVYDIYSQALQLAVLKIVRGDDFSFEIEDEGGIYYGSKTLLTASEANDLFHNLIDGWLDSITTGIWDERFATAYNYDITVLSGDNYKSFFTVSESAVPEPATLAIIGLGLAGLGLTKRRQRRK